MPMKVLTFTSLEWLPKGGDYKRLRVTYTIVDEQFVGTPQESTQMQEHEMPVRINRTIWRGKHISRPDWEKVALEYAKRRIASKLRQGQPLTEGPLRINSYTPNIHSLDPDTIELALHSPILLEIDRPLGFLRE